MRNQLKSELKELQATGWFFFYWGLLADNGEASAWFSPKLAMPCPYCRCICTQPLASTCLHPLAENRFCDDARLCPGALRSNTCPGLLMFKQLCWICQRVSDRAVKNWSLSKQHQCYLLQFSCDNLHHPKSSVILHWQISDMLATD